MEYLVTLSAIAVALLFVAMSPGPAFVLVVQQAVARSRQAGVITAFGVSVGSIVWVALILLGISVVLEQAAWLYGILRLLGGAYLIYLGVQLWRGAAAPVARVPRPIDAGRSLRRLFGKAVLLQLLNPKAAVFFTSVFLTMLPSAAPVWAKGAALAIVFVIEFGWYLVVAATFSSAPARRGYANARGWLERLAGAWLAFFGIRLALSDR